jgi:Beta protein
MLNFNQNHYVPIVKWRQGEYQALMNLANDRKDKVTPLLEIPQEKWDFDEEKPSVSLDHHMSKFGKRLYAKWRDRYCFVDSGLIEGAEKMADGTHHLVHIFELARNEGAKPIPVTGLSRHRAYQAATRTIIQTDERGVCIRLTPSDFSDKLPLALSTLISQLGVNVRQVHLLVDTSDTDSSNADALAESWKQKLNQIPTPKEWATLTIAGSSFPQQLPSTIYRPHNLAPRNEWQAYQAIREHCLHMLGRIPSFGDYACTTPHAAKLDPRLIDPTAKIKYTTPSGWFITVGKKVKEHGRNQYHMLCADLVAHKPLVYCGRKYSHGDQFIDDCANGGTTGSPGSWPAAASNHHITMVTLDLANFHGTSKTP